VNLQQHSTQTEVAALQFALTPQSAQVKVQKPIGFGVWSAQSSSATLPRIENKTRNKTREIEIALTEPKQQLSSRIAPHAIYYVILINYFQLF